MLPVPEGLVGERLDVAVSRLLGLSRTRAADLVDGGHVTVDSAVPARSARLAAGQVLEVRVPQVSRAPAPPQPVDGLVIRYQDADLVVVDKPVGVAAHASPGWTGPTVTGGLAATGVLLSDAGPAERQGVVHRLDVGTSGLMVLAKSHGAYVDLKAQFKQRTVEKIYHALVQGHPDPTEGTIDAPIGRHPHADYKWAVTAAGKPSVTHYRLLEAVSHASLLEVRLETGRTHQIRVHMAAVRHPCVGDLTYGADPVLARRLGLTRQWLHAVRLAFVHPRTGEWLSIDSPYPDDLGTALHRIAD